MRPILLRAAVGGAAAFSSARRHRPVRRRRRRQPQRLAAGRSPRSRSAAAISPAAWPSRTTTTTSPPTRSTTRWRSSPAIPSCSTRAFRLRMYAGRIDAAAQLAPQVLAIKPGDGFANLVLAIQQIKQGDYRAAEQQLGRIGAENQLGPLRDYVLAWLKAGQKDFVAARAALAKLKPAAGERAEAPALVDRGADRRDGGRQGGGRGQVSPRRRARSAAACAPSSRRPTGCAASARTTRRARILQDLRRQVQRLGGDGRRAGGQRADAQAAVAGRRASPRSCSTSAASWPPTRATSAPTSR